MRAEEKEIFIKEKAKEHRAWSNEKIMWSLHAVKKLKTDNLEINRIEDCLKECVIIEDYKMDARPLPGCLVLGYAAGRPVHVVVAVDREYDRIFIITVYRPTEARWQSDWKTRK